MRSAKNAEKALREIVEYRRRLDSDADKELARALDRVVDVLQRHIFHAVFDVMEFYETTLQSEDISKEEKTSIALDIAMRWEQIDSSSTALSANSLLERLKPDKLEPSARSHSLHHIEGSTRDKISYQNLPLALRRMHLTSPGGNNSASPVLANNGETNRNRVSILETAHSLLDSGCHRVQIRSAESLRHQRKASNPKPPPPRRPRRHRRLLPRDDDDEPNQSEQLKWVGRAPSPSTSSSLESFRRLASGGAGGGQTFHLQLVRSPSDGFGFSIAGGSDQEPLFDGCVQGFVYVAHISPGGVADKDGRLAINDRIISVNGTSLIGISHTQAVSIFERSDPHLDLVVERTYQRPCSKLSRPQVVQTKRHSDYVHQRSTSSQRTFPSHEETPFETSLPSPLSSQTPDRHRRVSIRSLNRANEADQEEGEEESDVPPLRPRLSRAPCVPLVTDSPKSNFSVGSDGSIAKPGSLSGAAIGGPGEASYLPTTVSPLSSMFTMPCGPVVVRATSEARRIGPSPRPRHASEGKDSRPLHPSRDTDEGLSDTSEDVWLFDPESTLGGQASLSAKSATEMKSCEDLSGVSNEASRSPYRREKLLNTHGRLARSDYLNNSTYRSHQSSSSRSLPRRPLPMPSPGPVIIEVPLVRGTRNGFGFSIAGGRDSQYIEGDSGIFITQIAPGGVADTSGRFTIGDRLVRVNGICLDEVTHEEAVNALQSAGDFALLVLVKNERASLRQSLITDYKSMARSLVEFTSVRMRDSSLNALDRNGNQQFLEYPANDSAEAKPGPRKRRQSGHRKKLLATKGSSTSIPQLHVCQAPGGLCGREDYVATTAIKDSILRRWPQARLVTLFKYNSTASGETRRAPPDSTGGSLGFNIVGGGGTKGIFISHIQPNSPAASSRKLQVGDRLLVVNGVELDESNHEDAAILLKTAPNRVDLVLVFAPDDYKKLEEQFSRQNSNSSGDPNLDEHRPAQSVEAAGLFVRVLTDFDPTSMQNEAIPKNVLALHSGDVLQIINTADTIWWQARRILPSTCKPLGPVGLVPNPKRLKRYVLARRAAEAAARATIKQHRAAAAASPANQNNPSASISPSQSLSSFNNEPSTDRTGNAIESLPILPATERSQQGSRSSSSAPSPSKLHHQSSSPEHRTRNRSVTDSTQGSKANSVPKGRTQSSRTDLWPHYGPPLTYVPVVAIESVHARPVVILGDLKESLTDDLLSDFPGRFGTCVPYTTRPRRKGEVEGRDYYFCKSRAKMESEIAMNKFVEAGEYNGNLYGTHIQSVFKVSASGRHCLLDVGGPALARLTKAGLPPIAILVNGSAGLMEGAQGVRVLNPPSGSLSNCSKDDSTKAAAEQIRKARIREKTGDFLKHFSAFLTAVVSAPDYESAYELVKVIIENNEGPRVWVACDEPLP